MPEKEYPRAQIRTGEWLYEKLSERSLEIEDIERKKVSRDAIAKRDLTRWYEALEANMQTFTVQEALLLCSALNGVKCSAGTLYGNIAGSEAIESRHYDEIDKSAFLDRIRNLEYMQAWAVIDAVERAWNTPTYGNIDLKKRVLLVGLVG